MIRNVLAGIGFLTVVGAGAAGVYATRWNSGDQPERLAVSVRGLDLTNSEGQRLLDLRVNAAIDRVCDSRGSYSMSRFEEQDCRRKARAGADPQIARAIDRAFARAGYGSEVGDDYPVAPDNYAPEPAYAPVAPEPAYAPTYAPSVVRVVTKPQLREKHTTITRKTLKPRVKWVKTRHGVVKKVVHRKLVRKTVKKVYA